PRRVRGLEQRQPQHEIHRDRGGLDLEAPDASAAGAAAAGEEAAAELQRRLAADVRVVAEEVGGQPDVGQRVEVVAEAAAPRERAVELHVLVGAGTDARVVELDVVIAGEARPGEDVREPLRGGRSGTESEEADDQQHREPALDHGAHSTIASEPAVSKRGEGRTRVNSPRAVPAAKRARRRAAGPRTISSNCLVSSRATTISRSPHTWPTASRVARMRWGDS